MSFKEKLKNLADSLFDLIKVLVVSAMIVIPIRYYLFQPFFVRGASMVPNFHDGEYLIIDEISYRFKEPQRGDVIVFKYPKDTTQYYIKRIIGLPGERVEIKYGDVYVYTKDSKEIRKLLLENYLPTQKITYPLGAEGASFEAGDGEYIVFGDNRLASSDSREWGKLPKYDIVGKVFLRAFPLNEASLFLSVPKADLIPVPAGN
jgi:signal peptidase I